MQHVGVNATNSRGSYGSAVSGSLCDMYYLSCSK